MNYRVKSNITVNAIQWKGDNISEIQSFVGTFTNLTYASVKKSPYSFENDSLYIDTSCYFGGEKIVVPLNSYIVKENDYKFSVYKANEFESIYERF